MLLVANLVDLSAIASVGSAIALAVFVLVGVAGWRRRADTGANPVIAVAAIGVAVIVLAYFAVDTLRNEPVTFVAILAITILAIVLDFAWKHAATASPGAIPLTATEPPPREPETRT